MVERVLLGSGNSANPEWDPQRVRESLEMLCIICVWKSLTEFTFLADILSSTCWDFFLEVKLIRTEFSSLSSFPPRSCHTVCGQCAMCSHFLCASPPRQAAKVPARLW